MKMRQSEITASNMSRLVGRTPKEFANHSQRALTPCRLYGSSVAETTLPHSRHVNRIHKVPFALFLH